MNGRREFFGRFDFGRLFWDRVGSWRLWSMFRSGPLGRRLGLRLVGMIGLERLIGGSHDGVPFINEIVGQKRNAFEQKSFRSALE
jgi:hypothetical protein